jgi:hypothetical protein
MAARRRWAMGVSDPAGRRRLSCARNAPGSRASRHCRRMAAAEFTARPRICQSKEADPGMHTVRELCTLFYDGVISPEHKRPDAYKCYLDRDLARFHERRVSTIRRFPPCGSARRETRRWPSGSQSATWNFEATVQLRRGNWLARRLTRECANAASCRWQRGKTHSLPHRSGHPPSLGCL